MIAQLEWLVRRGRERLMALLRRWKPGNKARVSANEKTGAWGERLAERLLRKKGYRILGRRVRLSARDELDLVVRHQNVLVFVEVKTRRSEDFGRPVTAVNARKRHAMTRAAMRYVQRLKHKPPFIRFDVVEVVGCPREKDPLVRHIESCFTLEKPHTIPW